jgi:adenine-specific DNA methylase
MEILVRKKAGAFYTPQDTVATLVKWAVRRPTDRMLDPACGDGRFLAHHPRSFGIERDTGAAALARQRSPSAQVYASDFFHWAAQTSERFECAAGNPPFIRYQQFTGEVRRTALQLCEKLGAKFTSLTSSWAPFLVATASLLKPGGRLAFVVPAEIGHAPYATPLLEYLADHFAIVHVIAIRSKIFRELSEDCWLLYAEGFGDRATGFRFTSVDELSFASKPPKQGFLVSRGDWAQWNKRLRPFLLSPRIRSLYRRLADSADSWTLGSVATVGIGYVTGANDFFHLRPSAVRFYEIPSKLLKPAVRNGRMLNGAAVTVATVEEWLKRDEPMLLLRLRKGQELPRSVLRYLNTSSANAAKHTYKCRNRDPWYVVPDVRVPHAFLSYMAGGCASLVANKAGCVCTNSLHAVTLRRNIPVTTLQERWKHPLVEFSCEVEGHPLGGGMLKLEPGEAARVVLPPRKLRKPEAALALEGLMTMRKWRHCGEET